MGGGGFQSLLPFIKGAAVSTHGHFPRGPRDFEEANFLSLELDTGAATFSRRTG